MVPAWQYQCLERPYRPERHQRHEALVPAEDAFALLQFYGQVVAEQAPAVGRIRPLLAQFPRRLVGHSLVGPDLPVRVWVAGTHHGAAVLEDEDVAYPVDSPEFDVLAGPGLDHLPDRVLLHLAEGEVVDRAPLVDHLLHLPLPGTRCAVRRYQKPFAGQPIQPAVRGIEHANLQVIARRRTQRPRSTRSRTTVRQPSWW